MGSSLIRGVKSNLENMLEAQGIEADIRVLAPSLRTLAWHDASKRSMSFLSGKNAEAWDYVILQENGGVQQYPPGMTNATSYQALRNLHEKITATGAKTLVFMVWQDRSITPRSPAGDARWQILKGDPTGNVGNVPIAFELNIGVIPVGWGVRAARMEEGEYMDEMLYNGGMGHHLSPLGRYLGACATYAAILGKSPVGLASPGKLSAADASFVQSVAKNVVIDNQATWNLILTHVSPY